MVGLIVIVGLGLFVLLALLYATRLDDNHDVVEGVEPQLGYRVMPPTRTGLGLPVTTRSPVDLVFRTELGAGRALARAASEHAAQEQPADEQPGPPAAEDSD